MNGAKSRAAANYQSEDKAIDNEDDMEMEFVTFVKSPPSGKKMNSNNNDQLNKLEDDLINFVCQIHLFYYS